MLGAVKLVKTNTQPGRTQQPLVQRCGIAKSV